ncbi:MAG: hypothetical protein ACE147_16885 [Candidatus Methylomirabilales bacterium]
MSLRVLRRLGQRCLKAWLRSADADGPPAPDVASLLREAIRLKKQIVAYRDRCFLVFCPHALGSRAGRLHVLAFVLLGETVDNEDLQSPARWRWIPVSELSGVAHREGYWFTAPRESRPPLERGTIELEAA